MSKLVTFEQAKKLKELGYDKDVVRYYKDDGFVWRHTSSDNECRFSVDDLGCNSNGDDGKYSAPSTSEALEWFREAKGVPCSVMLFSFFDDSIRYTGRYRIDVYGGWVERETEYYYDTHSEAESALLDALIEYIL